MQNGTKETKKRSMFLSHGTRSWRVSLLAVVLTKLLLVCLENAPASDLASLKKSKPASSAEEEDKEVFVLHVRKVALYLKCCFKKKSYST